MNHEPQASGSRLKIDFAQASDPGRDPNKQVNEDSCGYAETRFGHLAVLCDGMGGHYGGKEASRTAITTIFEMFEQMPLSTAPAQALKAAIEEAGRRVYLLGGPPDNRARPGSTVVAMLLHDRGLDVAHVGDSRAYIIRSNQIYPLTRDHSMVQGMIDAGMLTEETAMGHPDSNKITRALGMRPDVEVELRPESMEVFAGDLLLQSSDGLTDLALGRDILGATRQALASGSVEHACNMLVRLANDRGGHDNITVQIVRVKDVGAKVTATIPERPVSLGNPGGVPQTPPAVSLGNPGGVPQTPPGVSLGNAGGVPQTPPGATPGQPGYAQGAPSNGWAPVQPTPHDPTSPGHAPQGAVAPTPPDYGVTSQQRPTLNDTPPPTQAWSPAAPPAHAPGATPAPGLGAYRIDAGAGALPLPPASVRPPPYGSATPAAGPVGYTPSPGGYTPGPPMATPMPGAYGAVSSPRGGIVFVILGLSGVIAVLIIVVVWALWLRG